MWHLLVKYYNTIETIIMNNNNITIMIICDVLYDHSKILLLLILLLLSLFILLFSWYCVKNRKLKKILTRAEFRQSYSLEDFPKI